MVEVPDFETEGRFGEYWRRMGNVEGFLGEGLGVFVLSGRIGVSGTVGERSWDYRGGWLCCHCAVV